MAFDRFMIAPLQGGLQTNVRPWLIPDDAFAQLNNAYVFRGRVRKRFGGRFLQGSTPRKGSEQLQSRLRVRVGTIGAPASPVPGIKFQIGQLFSVGDLLFTVYQTGNPAAMLVAEIIVGTTDSTGNATGITPTANGALGQIFTIGSQTFTVTVPVGALTTGGPATGTFNIGTGAFTFTGATPNSDIRWTTNATGTFSTVTGAFTLINTGYGAATPIYWYPAQPVMGLATLEQSAINDELLVAFDTQFAYQYTINGFERLEQFITGGASTWTGSDSQFFWTTNNTGTAQFQNILYATNFNQTEPNFMRFFDPDPAVFAWDNFQPVVSVLLGPVLDITLNAARILVVFKNRMVAFNTWEFEDDGMNPPNLRHYPQRARWSGYNEQLDQANGWRQDIPGHGSALDASTTEQIITVEFIKDRLIVYFERSTWELVYTGNQAQPFAWQQINTELGAEATFSIIPFDKVAIGVGNVGIHACNGTNVERIDVNIPQLVFDIHNADNGVERVYGIRDYYVEMIYWSLPDDTRNAEKPFNNQVLVFNYQTGTWAINDDSITAFGYFQQQQNGTATTWADLTDTWQEVDMPWGSAPLQAKFRNVIAGNQEGYVFLVDPNITRNAPALQITNISTTPATTFLVVNHNLALGDFILIENCQGITTFNNNIYQVQRVIDANTFDIGGVPFTGVYTGAGTITRVSVIDILTKQYNFYDKQGKNAYIQKVDFLVDRTANGEFTADVYLNSSDYSQVTYGQLTGALLGTNVVQTTPYALIPFEQQQVRLWHPVYPQAEGEVIQLRLYLSDTQMQDPAIALSNFTLHAMTFYAQPTSRLQ